MSIRKGQEWGSPSVVPAGVVECSSDAALAQRFLWGDRDFVVSSGDLHRVLGQPAPKRVGMSAQALPVDILEVRIRRRDGSLAELACVSSVVVGSWWRGRLTVVTNSGRFGEFDMAPRAHPNDGLMDVVTVDDSMPYRQRVMARRRARTGQHLPHPSIHTSREVDFTVASRRGEVLAIDGSGTTDWLSASVTVAPDAFTVYV